MFLGNWLASWLTIELFPQISVLDSISYFVHALLTEIMVLLKTNQNPFTVRRKYLRLLGDKRIAKYLFGFTWKYSSNSSI